MKRPSADAKIGPPVKWTGRHYLPLAREEIELRERLRQEIKRIGVLDAHAEYMRRLPPRSL